MTVSTIQVSVDLYSFEGGQYSLQGAQVLSVSTSKKINDDSGTFSLVLTPGGPNGIDAPPYWSQIITPMSLCVIGARRGNRSGILMVGVVTSPVETQNWRSGGSVQRAVSFSGRDFTFYFSQRDWYSLFYLSLLGAGSGSGGLPSILSSGLSQGPPDKIGKSWFDQIMKATLASTYVPFNGSQVAFPAAVGELFEPYGVVVPFADYFVSGDTTWSSKFRTIFPFPWYEFFVTTAPGGAYKETSQGYQFTTKALGQGVAGGPVLVARVNPVPSLVSSIVGGVPSFTGADLSRWDGLENYTLDEGALLSNGVSFDERTVNNFYTINPTYAAATNGGSNSSIVPPVVNFAAIADRASINRYGFRPANAAFSWYADPTGDQGANGAAGDLQALAGKLLGAFCGYYHPTPLMAKGAISMPLRPDILIGTTFTYSPWKGSEAYDFYVEGVDHIFMFGGESKTTLQLTRGLPSYVYDDPALLLDVMTGNAQRKDNVYVSGLPSGSATPLKAISLAGIQAFFGDLSRPYLTPQSP